MKNNRFKGMVCARQRLFSIRLWSTVLVLLLFGAGQSFGINLSIDSGADYTLDQNVTLQTTSICSPGYSQSASLTYCNSGGSCSSGSSTVSNWGLTPGDGTKTVSVSTTCRQSYQYQCGSYICGSYCCSRDRWGSCTRTCYDYCPNYCTGYYYQYPNTSDSIVLDATAPGSPTVTSLDETYLTKPVWTWQSGGDALSGASGTYRVKIDDADLSAGTTAVSGGQYAAPAELVEGFHTLYVQEQDVAGNWSATAAFRVWIDTLLDSDYDDLIDADEVAGGTDRFNEDSDGDGTIDSLDHAPLDAGVGQALMFASADKVFKSGEDVLVMWDAVAAAAAYKLKYSLDNGTSWSAIPLEAAQTSVSWTTPIVEKQKKDCLIKLTAKDDAGVTVGKEISSSAFTVLPPAPIELLSPDGSESLLAGSSLKIAWNAPLAAASINLKSSLDGGMSWETIDNLTSDQTSYAWDVPASVVDKPNCLIKATAKDIDGNKLSSDNSEPFTVLGTLQFIAPDGGEKLLAGDALKIAWNAPKSAATITFKYSLDGAASWQALADVAGDQSSYSWTLPAVSADTDVVIQAVAKDETGAKVSKTISPEFAILGPLQLTSPKAGEQVPFGKALLVTWQASKETATVKLKSSLDNGATWQSIASVPGDQTSYKWAIPAGLTDLNGCLINAVAKDVDGNTISKDTVGPFSVLGPVQLANPNGGEQWMSGTDQGLTWTAAELPAEVAKVKLTYTLNGGKTWAPLVTLSGLDAQGSSYTWTIPVVSKAKAKAQVKLVLKSASGETLGNDTSDPFTVLPSPYQTSLVEGVYRYGEIGTDSAAWNEIAKLTFDGVGTLTHKIIASSYGDTGRKILSYSVAPDGALLVEGEEVGFVSADGGLFVVQDTDPLEDGDINLTVSLRESAGMTQDALVGSYRYFQFGYDDAAWAAEGTLTFADEGAGSFVLQSDSSASKPAAGDFAYSLAETGKLSIDGVDGGIVSEDGSLLIFTDVDRYDTDQDIDLLLAVKEPRAMTDAALSGEYLVGQIGDDGQQWVAQLLLTFNGDGTGDYVVLADSGLGVGDSGSMDYAVDFFGKLTVPGMTTGQVSADGSTFVLINTDAGSGSVEMMIGVRRNAEAPGLGLSEPPQGGGGDPGGGGPEL